ncbi:Protein-lysine N-methyltransferase efm5 [Sorochytrium milnesiophthora]
MTPYRGEDDEPRHLKLMGDLGRIVQLKFDIFNEKQLAECMRHSDIVYNLIGRDYETKNFSFANVNVDAARNIARIAREEGVPTLVHMSCLSARHDSPSAYLRTKAEGEQVVREQFPDAAIVRSATIYGHEDRFLNQLSWLSQFPLMPVMNEGKTIRRPVCVSDVATALANIGTNPNSAGKLYELYGDVYTLEECVDLFCELTRLSPNKAYPSKWISETYAKFVDLISPYPKISPDVIKRMYIDEVPTRKALTFADAGVPEPQVFEYASLEYLRRFRHHDDFHLPGRQHAAGKRVKVNAPE